MSEPQVRELTQKMRAWTLLTFQTNEPTDSYMKIYKCKSKGVAAASATRLLKKVNVQAYLAELRQKTLDDSVATVLERKQRLTEILRGRITDFQTVGADGSWLDVGPENEHAGAVSEITSTTKYDENGATPAVITRVKLHDPVRAAAELNKMGGDYAPVKTELTGKDGGPVEVQLDARAKIISLISRYATGKREEEDNPELDRPGS